MGVETAALSKRDIGRIDQPVGDGSIMWRPDVGFIMVTGLSKLHPPSLAVEFDAIDGVGDLGFDLVVRDLEKG